MCPHTIVPFSSSSGCHPSGFAAVHNEIGRQNTSVPVPDVISHVFVHEPPPQRNCCQQCPHEPRDHRLHRFSRRQAERERQSFQHLPALFVASVGVLPCARRDLVLARSWFQKFPSARRATNSALLVQQALDSVACVAIAVVLSGSLHWGWTCCNVGNDLSRTYVSRGTPQLTCQGAQFSRPFLIPDLLEPETTVF